MSTNWNIYFTYIENVLNASLSNFGTQTILDLGLTHPGSEWATWDDFLGNNDTDILGNKVEYHEDRIFTTSGEKIP
jgi:hypothetical protein